MIIRKTELFLTILFILGITLLCSLGFWQLFRAEAKTELLAQRALAQQQPPLSLTELAAITDFNPFRYRAVRLTGKLLDDHAILHDNRVQQGVVGYDWYSLMLLTPQRVILVARDFVVQGPNRSILPATPPTIGEVTIEGYLDFPYLNRWIKQPVEPTEIAWPLRMQNLDTMVIQDLIGKEVVPVLVKSDFSALSTLPVSPQRHRAYAFQWFSCALVLGLIGLWLGFKRARHDKKIT